MRAVGCSNSKQFKVGERIYLYAFVLLNSISGLKIADISVNAAIIISFLLYITFKYLLQPHDRRILAKKHDAVLLFLSASLISCLFSMAMTFSIPHISVVASYLVNSVVYLIIYLLICNMHSPTRLLLSATYRGALIFAARVQAVWGIAQLVLLYGAGININEILFVDILHSTTVRDWIMGFYTGNTWNLRITGLNFENSMFALVVCMGIALETNRIWKLFMICVVVLSLSRTGWFMLVGYLLYWLYINRNKLKKIKKNKIALSFLAFAFALSTGGLLYVKVPAVRAQILNIVVRATDSDAVHISGARHFLYYPYGLDIWLFRSNAIQMLFGYGMRCSGIAFSQQQDICNIIGIGSYPNAWAVECDVIGLLLGGGIITFIAYYVALFKNFRIRASQYKGAILMIFLGGITYHYHSISYVIFIIMMASYERDRKTNSCAFT